MDSEAEIVPMDEAMAKKAWQWANSEGWNPGFEDHLLLSIEMG